MNHDHTDHRAIPPAGSDPYDRFAADPFAPTTPAPPVGQPAPTAQPVRHRWWMHVVPSPSPCSPPAVWTGAGRHCRARWAVCSRALACCGCWRSNIESASLNLKYPFGLSLSKPCAALRQAQRERFK